MALDTTTEILTRIKEELRDRIPTSSTSSRLLNRVNEAYLDIVGGGNMLNSSLKGYQSQRPYIFSSVLSENNIIFNTELPIENLTVTIAQESASATLSSTYATSLAGWFIRINKKAEVYKILSHTAGTAILTLDGEFTESDATAEDCVIFKLDYEIGSDILLPTNGLLNSYMDEPLFLAPKIKGDKIAFLRRVGEGNPTGAYIQKIDAVNKSITIRLNAYTPEIERLELPYIAYPAELDESTSNPIFSPVDNQLLVDYVVALEYQLRGDEFYKPYLERAIQRFQVMKARDKQFTHQHDPNFAKILAWSNSTDLDNSSSYPNYINQGI